MPHPVTRPIGTRRRFAADESGMTAAIFALALLPMVAAVGAAIDYSRVSQARAKLQGAVDAAVIAGLKAGVSQRPSVAERAFRSGFSFEGASIQHASFAPTANGGLRGRVKVRIPSLFGGVLGTDGIDIAALAEGEVRHKAASTQSAYACLMLMDPSAAEALRVDGGAEVRAPNCEVHIHTSANVGAVFNGNATVDVKRFCLKGPGYVANGQPRLGPIETGCRTAADPFAGRIPAPENRPCDHTDAVFSPKGGKSGTTLAPGVYCGRTTFKGNRTILFQPGLYVIRDGAMTIGGGSTIKGSGVTFHFGNAQASLQLDGSTETQLSAPTSGPYAGVLMFEPGGLQRTTMALNGAHGHHMSGLLYLPSRNVTFNGASSVASENLTMVFNTLTVNGAADWRFDTATRTVPVQASTSTGTAEIVLRY